MVMVGLAGVVGVEVPEEPPEAMEAAVDAKMLSGLAGVDEGARRGQ